MAKIFYFSPEYMHTFLYPLNLSWFCELLCLVTCPENGIVLVPNLSLKKTDELLAAV
jgi:hypothetical protein